MPVVFLAVYIFFLFVPFIIFVCLHQREEEKRWATALFLNVLIFKEEAKQRNLIVDIESVGGRCLFLT